MSTRCEQERRGLGDDWPTARSKPRLDPAEEVALVARAKRELLLQVNRYRLRREDLEDCYSQATLELVALTRQGGVFADRLHVGNALELRFLSRVRDRRRALKGRSPMQAALEAAMSLGGVGEEEVAIVDRRAEVEKLVMLRHDLGRIELLAAQLSPDQRLVLACQLGLETSCGEFCRRFGWSPEKYRKVAQRARSRLRRLMTDEPECPARGAVSEKETGTRL